MRNGRSNFSKNTIRKCYCPYHKISISSDYVGDNVGKSYDCFSNLFFESKEALKFFEFKNVY